MISRMMRNRLIHWACAIEVICCVVIYLVGPYGFVQLKELKYACCDVQMAIDKRIERIKELEQEVIAWNVHPYLRERVAREQLKLAYPHEQIYSTSYPTDILH